MSLYKQIQKTFQNEYKERADIYRARIAQWRKESPIVRDEKPTNLPSGTQVSPVMSVNYSSSIPVIGSCGIGSLSGPNSVNVGNVTIGEIAPIKVTLYATPSGFFNEGNIFIPSKLNVTAKISRDSPQNYEIDEVISNITIYYFNYTNPNAPYWQNKLSFTDIHGSEGTQVVNGRTLVWSNSTGEITMNLNETISSSNG